jgi:hypothetical protein
MTTTEIKTEISRKALSIAGCLWEDREKTGTLTEQLRSVAAEPAHGTDGDLTAADRADLLKLAAQAASIAKPAPAYIVVSKYDTYDIDYDATEHVVSTHRTSGGAKRACAAQRRGEHPDARVLGLDTYGLPVHYRIV